MQASRDSTSASRPSADKDRREHHPDKRHYSGYSHGDKSSSSSRHVTRAPASGHSSSSVSMAASSSGKTPPPKSYAYRAAERVERPLKVKDYRGKHTFVVAGTSFHVEKKYEYIKQIGVGAYGVVISAIDRKADRKVAIKKVPKAFEDLIDAKRIVREIKLLRFFKHDNIISLLDVPKPDTRTGYEDIYIVTDLMETDLHRVIYSRQVSCPRSPSLGINRRAYSVLYLSNSEGHSLHAFCQCDPSRSQAQQPPA